MQISQLILDLFYGNVKFDPTGKNMYKITGQRDFFKLSLFGHSDKMFHLTLNSAPGMICSCSLPMYMYKIKKIFYIKSQITVQNDFYETAPVGYSDENFYLTKNQSPGLICCWAMYSMKS